MKKSSSYLQFKTELLEDDSKLFSIVGNLKHLTNVDDSNISIKVDNQLSIIGIKHPCLSDRDLEFLRHYFFQKSSEKLLEIDRGLLYRLKQKALLEMDDDLIDEDETLDDEDFIDSVELEQAPIIQEALEDLRALGMYIKYPETNGRVLTQNLKGHLICRCFGVTRESISSFIDENPEIKLKELTSALSVGAGCGSCTQDVNKVLEEKQRQQNPSSIEWMLSADENLKQAFSANWGEFLEVSSSEIVVALKNITESDFESTTNPNSLKDYTFIYRKLQD